MIVEAAAGIGKTTLLGVAGDIARAAGIRPLRARASELEAAFAFGVVRQLFEPVLRELPDGERARVLHGAAALSTAALSDRPGLTAVGGDASFACLHGLYWLCANLCEHEPVLLSIDDLHWCDPPSLRFLTFLAARLEEHPIVLLVSARPQQRSVEEALGHLQALPNTRTGRPRPLSQHAVARILTSELGEPEPAFARACHEAVAGNPFLLTELIGELRHEHVPPVAGNAQRVLTMGPRAVSRAMLARLAGLPAEASALARAIAILGDGAEVRHARALANIDASRAAEAADALARASILCRGERLSFVHPIVRQAVEQDMGPRQRSAAHAQAARLLSAEGAPGGRVALHLLACDPNAEAVVAETLLEQAAAAIDRGAPDVAARYLRRALAEPPPATMRGEVLRLLGRSELLTGDVRGLERLRAAVTLDSEPRHHAEVALELSGFLVACGVVADAVAVLEEALARLGDRDRELRLRLLAAITGIAMTDLEMSTHAHRRVSDLDEPMGDTPAERKVLAQLAMIESFAGRSASRCVDLARRALSGDTLVSEAALDPQMLVLASSVLLLADEIEEAHETFGQAISTCRIAGASMSYAIHCCFRSSTGYALGRLDEAEADVRTALRFTSEPMLAATIHGYTVSFLVDILLERGDIDAAEAALQLRGESFRDSATHDVTYMLLSRARVRLARHDTAAALDDLHDCSARLHQWRIVNPAWNAWRSVAVRAYLASDQRGTALQLAAEELKLARTFGAPRAIAVALRSSGLAVGGSAGIDLLRQAVDTLQQSPATLERARSMVELGAALRRANRRAEAREPLRRGLDLARRSGAGGLAERAREELVACGARPRRELLTGVEALTATELRVSRMAAQGLTNRDIAQALFVTTKTIESHLGHVYAKLKIHSRTQLGSVLA